MRVLGDSAGLSADALEHELRAMERAGRAESGPGKRRADALRDLIAYKRAAGTMPDAQSDASSGGRYNGTTRDGDTRFKRSAADAESAKGSAGIARFSVVVDENGKTYNYGVDMEDGLKHELPVLVGDRIVRFKDPKEHADDAVTAEYEASVDQAVVDYVQMVVSAPDFNSIKPKWIRISETASQRLIDAIRHLTGVDATGYTVSAMADTFIHIDERHGANGSADHSMADIRDVGRIGYALNNLDDLTLLTEEDGEPVLARGYMDKNGNRVPTLLARKQIDGHFMVSHVAPDSSRRTIYITSAYKNEEVPEQTDRSASAAQTLRPKTLLNLGTSTQSIPQPGTAAQVRFKRTAAVDDPDVLFGARESRRAHGLADLTAEESNLAYTDKELYAAGQRIAKDVPHMYDAIGEAFTSDRALSLNDTFALTVFLRDKLDALAAKLKSEVRVF